MINKNLPQSAIDFLNYMETIKGASINTIDGYSNDLTIFFDFIIHKKSETDGIKYKTIGEKFLNKITLSDLYSFMTFLEKERKNGKSTRGRKVATLRSYYDYLHTKAKIVNENIALQLEKPKAEKRNPIYLTLNQSKQLLTSMNENNTYYKRDYAILIIFLNTGVRISELRLIKLSDIRENKLTVIGKGNKERTVPLNDICLKAIKEHLPTRDNSKCIEENKDYLFLSRQNNPISKKQVEQIVEQYIKDAGLDGNKFTPHKLRHTASTLMYKYGKVDIVRLRDILGHENISTTQIYTHCDEESLQDAVNSNPLNNLL